MGLLDGVGSLIKLYRQRSPADMSDSEVKGKYFDEYYLYGMNSDELENWFE